MKNHKIKLTLSIATGAVFLSSIFCLPLTVMAETATNTPESNLIVFPDSDLSAMAVDASTTTATSTPALPTPAESEAKVREFFADDPYMISIARCESNFRQFNGDGTVLVGHGLYIGVFQIDFNIHAEAAKKIGLDIYTLEGNIAYAKILKDRHGYKLWPACARQAGALSSPAPAAINVYLKLGMTHDQVKTVQQILNNAGFIIAKDGAGSPGNETRYFGTLTRAAVKKFQCDKGIVCSGTEGTTGYGYVGPKTRAALLAAAGQ